MTTVRDNGRKDTILATAASQFRRRGYERTSVREIA
jgi:AcrR family transcriptional regulator